MLWCPPRLRLSTPCRYCTRCVHNFKPKLVQLGHRCFVVSPPDLDRFNCNLAPAHLAVSILHRLVSHRWAATIDDRFLSLVLNHNILVRVSTAAGRPACLARGAARSLPGEGRRRGGMRSADHGPRASLGASHRGPRDANFAGDENAVVSDERE